MQADLSLRWAHTKSCKKRCNQNSVDPGRTYKINVVCSGSAKFDGRFHREALDCHVSSAWQTMYAKYQAFYLKNKYSRLTRYNRN